MKKNVEIFAVLLNEDVFKEFVVARMKYHAMVHAARLTSNVSITNVVALLMINVILKDSKSAILLNVAMEAVCKENAVLTE
jgi:hypothetical protein